MSDFFNQYICSLLFVFVRFVRCHHVSILMAVEFLCYLCERKGYVKEKFKFRRKQKEKNDYLLY